MISVLITGARGQVGYCLQQQLLKRDDINLFAFGEDELDITNENQVMDVITRIKPQIVINAAAHTAVDKAETDKEASFAINRDGCLFLAKAVNAINGVLLHISTDYVFDGTKEQAYLETDDTNPQTVYGKSKLAGELAVVENCQQYAILRTAWVFGEHGNNFVKTMLKLAQTRDELSIINDQFGGPTYAGDIAGALIKMMDIMQNSNDDLSGIYHFSGLPHVTWYQFANKIFDIAEMNKLIKKPKLNPITTEQYPTPAKRPTNSRLNNDKIKENFDIEASDWQMALENIKEYAR